MSGKSFLRLMAVGDIGFIGEVSKNINIYGPEQPFQYVEPFLSRGDIVFGNLEKPFTKNSKLFFKYLSKNSIANLNGIDSLAHGHFNIVSLANNHILDFGKEGLETTIDLLNKKGIKHVGAGLNLEEARKPVIIEKKGIRVGFLSYSKKSESTATKNKPGAAPIDYRNVIREDIVELRKSVDFIVVSLHFGLMYANYPTQDDRKIAMRIVETGADIILGHHPHVIQGMEFYSKGIIIYSLGEFVFDSKMGNIHIDWAENKRRESLIFCANLSKEKIVKINFIPTLLNENYQPWFPNPKEKEKILKRFDKLSNSLYGLNSKEVNRHIANNIIKHQSKVLFFHLKKFNMSYLLKKFSKIRTKHLVYFLEYVFQINRKIF